MVVFCVVVLGRSGHSSRFRHSASEERRRRSRCPASLRNNMRQVHGLNCRHIDVAGIQENIVPVVDRLRFGSSGRISENLLRSCNAPLQDTPPAMIIIIREHPRFPIQDQSRSREIDVADIGSSAIYEPLRGNWRSMRGQAFLPILLPDPPENPLNSEKHPLTAEKCRRLAESRPHRGFSPAIFTGQNNSRL